VDAELMMIRFEKENNCFNYRVVGVAVHEDSVRPHRGEGEDFWTFPALPSFLQTALQEFQESAQHVVHHGE
jgi:hypothetical protein